MAVRLYSDRTILSKPRYDPDIEAWFPYASVTWRDTDGFNFFNFDKLVRVFGTKTEALDFGFTIARAWIDKSHDYLTAGLDEIKQ
jgi:hypothetical protein